MDSLKKRYFSKLFTSFVGVIIAVITQAIIPRGLGPKLYGDYNFLTNFFSQIIGFIDMGTSIGFYTKLSMRPKEGGLVSFYFLFTGIVFVVIWVGLLFVQLTPYYCQIWPGQQLYFVNLAAAFGMVTWVTQILNKMADAYGVTTSTELAKIIQKIFGLFLIVVLFWLDMLTLNNFFYYQYLQFILLGLLFIYIINKKGYLLKDIPRLSFSIIKKYSKEFYEYSSPLFTFALAGMFGGIADRWLLQLYGGSVEQGFYGLSYQIGAVCFLFTSAMTPLLMREFSIAFKEQDYALMAALFRRYIPLLYTVAAFFSCFVFINADKVIYLMGGHDYDAALLTVMIMAFYPIHQTYGQLSSSVFYATGQTKLYRNIGMIFVLGGVPVTYLLTNPDMGINAGALGLAIKMILVQIIGVNVQLYYNSKLLKLNFIKYIGHQIVSVAILLGLAWIATHLVGFVIIDTASNNIVCIAFILSAGIVYALLAGIVVFLAPSVAGIHSQDIRVITDFCLRAIEKFIRRK